MKKFVLIVTSFLAFATLASGWGGLGHQTVAEIAERHLTDRARKNISKYMPYELKKDASWMDRHRKDKPIAFTTYWHTFPADRQLRYDPNRNLLKKRGDAVFAVDLACYNLDHYEELTDSAVLMNLRVLIHCVGDMHCPVHVAYADYKQGGKIHLVTDNGKERDLKGYHAFYDGAPNFLWPGVKAPQLAEKLDTWKGGAIKKCCKGTVVDWADECAKNCVAIYKWRYPYEERADQETPVEFTQKDVDQTRDLVSSQLQKAGYRLAYLLNKYFDK
jgi:hypothetical protein